MLQYVDEVNHRAHRLRIDFENAKQVLPEPSPKIESANHSNLDMDKRSKRRLKRQQAKYQQDRYYLQQQLFYLVKLRLRIGDYQSGQKKDRHRLVFNHTSPLPVTVLEWIRRFDTYSLIFLTVKTSFYEIHVKAFHVNAVI